MGYDFDRMAPMHNKWQRALNEHWPPGDQARHIKDQPHPIPVTARIVWDKDGEEWVEGRAIRWTQHHVLVTVDDPRCQTIGFWLNPEDVRRR